MKPVTSIKINLDVVKEGLRVWIDSRKPGSLFDASESANEHNEARFQLVEGCFYDYQISDTTYTLGDVGGNIIQQHRRATNLGTIAPNIYVGRLSIPVIAKDTSEVCYHIELEVQSVKSGYRDDYRD